MDLPRRDESNSDYKGICCATSSGARNRTPSSLNRSIVFCKSALRRAIGQVFIVLARALIVFVAMVVFAFVFKREYRQLHFIVVAAIVALVGFGANSLGQRLRSDAGI